MTCSWPPRSQAVNSMRPSVKVLLWAFMVGTKDRTSFVQSLWTKVDFPALSNPTITIFACLFFRPRSCKMASNQRNRKIIATEMLHLGFGTIFFLKRRNGNFPFCKRNIGRGCGGRLRTIWRRWSGKYCMNHSPRSENDNLLLFATAWSFLKQRSSSMHDGWAWTVTSTRTFFGLQERASKLRCLMIGNHASLAAELFITST